MPDKVEPVGLNGTSTNGKTPTDTAKYLPIRWAVAILGFALHTMVDVAFISLTPVANYADTFYGANSANRATTAFFVSAFLGGIVAIWALERFGLKACLYFCAALNCAGAGMKLLSCSGLIADHSARFAILLTAQLMIGCSSPFIGFSTTKLGVEWFPFHQRPIAVAIVNVGPACGICISNLIVPSVVAPPRNEAFMTTLAVELRNLHLAIFCISLALFPITFFILRFAFKQYDAQRVDSEKLDSADAGWTNMDRVKFIFRNRPFILLTIVFGAGLGVFNSLFSLMQQMLCPVGYSNVFAGISNSILIGSSIAGGLVGGIFVGKTRLYDETMKVCMVISMVTGVAFAEFIVLPGFPAAVGVCAAFFGFFGGAVLPVALELGSEAAYPMSESFSNGVIQFSGSIQTAFNIALSQLLAKPTTKYSSVQTCTSPDSAGVVTPRSWIVSMLVLSALQALLQVIFILAFKPQFNRRRAELQQRKSAALENVAASISELVSNSCSSGSVSTTIVT